LDFEAGNVEKTCDMRNDLSRRIFLKQDSDKRGIMGLGQNIMERLLLTSPTMKVN